jgi:hypothetical protein
VRNNTKDFMQYKESFKNGSSSQNCGMMGFKFSQLPRVAKPGVLTPHYGFDPVEWMEARCLIMTSSIAIGLHLVGKTGHRVGAVNRVTVCLKMDVSRSNYFGGSSSRKGTQLSPAPDSVRTLVLIAPSPYSSLCYCGFLFENTAEK